MSDQDTIQYYRNREVAARASAAKASDPLAARLHLELADEYAKVARGEEDVRRLLDARTPTYIIPEGDEAPDDSQGIAG